MIAISSPVEERHTLFVNYSEYTYKSQRPSSKEKRRTMSSLWFTVDSDTPAKTRSTFPSSAHWNTVFSPSEICSLSEAIVETLKLSAELVPLSPLDVSTDGSLSAFSTSPLTNLIYASLLSSLDNSPRSFQADHFARPVKSKSDGFWSFVHCPIVDCL